MDLAFYGFSVRDWLTAGATGAVAMAGLILVRWIVVARLQRVAARTDNRVDDCLVEIVHTTRNWFFAVIAIFVAGTILGLSPPIQTVLRGALVVAAALQVAIWGNVAIAAAIMARNARHSPDGSAEAATLGVVGLAARGVLYAVLLLLMLDNLGINVSALVAGLGIGGVAVALAVQNILGDLFASLSIVLDRPFVVGDFIVVGDLMGSVEHIGVKTTRIRSLSGEQLVFANSDLLGSRIRNFKRMSERRVVFTIGVTYQTSAEQLARIPAMLREAVIEEPTVRFDRAHFRSCDDSALTFEIVYYVQDPDYNRYMDIQQRINLSICRRFEANRISFAYPTRTIFVHRETESAAMASLLLE